MDKEIYFGILFDYYGELLTDKQKQYFEDYYFQNLSLSEISENENISRNAVHTQIKYAEKKLEFYEEKLHLYENGEKIRLLIQNMEPAIKEKIEELI